MSGPQSRHSAYCKEDRFSSKRPYHWFLATLLTCLRNCIFPTRYIAPLHGIILGKPIRNKGLWATMIESLRQPSHLTGILQYIPRNMHTVFALLCFVVVIHWLIFPYPSGLLHWRCGNPTIAPVPAFCQLKFSICVRCDMAFIEPMHRNKPNITYLLTPVPAKQPWWIWINTSCELIMNDCITTTKQSTTKPCAYFLRYTVCQLLIIMITEVLYNSMPLDMQSYT